MTKNPKIVTHNTTQYRFRLFPVRSPLLGESCVYHRYTIRRWFLGDIQVLLFSFPLATEMFHFTRSSLYTYEFSIEYLDITQDGFPHSDIPGSTVAWDLPEAFRTLRRPSSFNSVKAFTVRSYTYYENTKLCFLFVCLQLTLDCNDQCISTISTPKQPHESLESRSFESFICFYEKNRFQRRQHLLATGLEL